MQIKTNVSFALFAVVLCMIAVLAATGWHSSEAPQTKTSPSDRNGVQPAGRPAVPDNLFEKWPKPDLAIVLTGEQHGYLLPCGCSRPQTGGLERRYNLLETLKKAGWPVVAVDLGDVAQKKGVKHLPNQQGLLKYVTSMKALKEMRYLGVGVGEHETTLPLLTGLTEYSLNNPEPPVLAANLMNRATDFVNLVGDLRVEAVRGSKFRVGVASVIGPDAAMKIKDRNVKLESNSVVLPKIIKDFAQKKADVRVLLYQGTADKAKLLAKDFPQFQVILCLSNDSEPSSLPIRTQSSLIISVGHKGRYVGVVGVFRPKKKDAPFEMRYQLVALREDFLTPDAARKNHPIVRLMEDYTRRLKDEDYLSKYGQRKHPHQVVNAKVAPKYVGSHKCKGCHGRAYRVWDKSKHAHAYDALVQAKFPSNRQFDAECVVCHTVGFGYESGYTSVVKTPLLKDVGCESCHGPGGAHVDAPNNKQWHELMNPWRTYEAKTEKEKQQRFDQMDVFCQKCHDVDNDVNWKFSKRWPEVEH